MLSTASPSSSTSIRSRSIISLSKASPYTSTPRTVFPSSALPLQRRWASEAAETQSEPEADGAAEAEHGDNSIAASAESEAEDLTESTKETASSATETARSAASGISHAASTAAQSVAGTAESLGAAAGFGAGKSSYSAPGSDLAPSTTLYVGNLFFDVRAEDLRKEFSRAGPIKEAKIIHDQRGLSKGCVNQLSPVQSIAKGIHLRPLPLTIPFPLQQLWLLGIREPRRRPKSHRTLQHADIRRPSSLRPIQFRALQSQHHRPPQRPQQRRFPPPAPPNKDPLHRQHVLRYE